MSELQASEVLCIPKRRRLTHSRIKNDDGQEILHLFYGEIELIFDEPDIAPLGEKLIEVEHFSGQEVMSWTSGVEWERVRELLQALLDSQVIKRQAEIPAAPADAFPKTLGLAPPGREPQTFTGADGKCPMITEEAFGRAFDLPNLEVVVPIYRIAHPAMDTDGRQIGENNVTPRTLFLDLPTQRRLCGYAGSRYHDELPMNVTALKHMAKRWPELLSLTEQSRVEIFRRLPPGDPAALRAGELHFLAVCQLASVGYVMVRGEHPVANGELDSGLSAMFRLVDGVRLVTNDLLRERLGGRGWETPVSAQSVADFAEHFAIYRGTHGVCAGPPALIDEYLKVLTGEASAPIEAEPPVTARLGDVDAAIDYALLGQRIEAAVRYLGNAQGLLHLRMRAAFAGQTPPSALQELVEVPLDAAHFPQLREDHPPLETFQLELEVCRWLFARAGQGLPARAEPAELDELDELDALMRLDAAAQEATQRRLAELLAFGLPPDKALAAPLSGQLAALLAESFALERRCLRVVEREQAALNERLRRPAGRQLTSADLAAYNRPRCGPAHYQLLADGLGLEVRSTSAATSFTYGGQTLTITD